ncbi:uncharacterized protein EV420DRAFT_1622437 [Desarmillaria tabescens]|uniref:Uncharacterized protein n=1 Tax=Armillaria tabescens TaxID=1929756 RepID=A0AA39JRC6_ARMTA|nr:uncharacterized protein EV420DRAFT_1622437 [Desarmillaria tabescens]KAK0447487.1 hypothetical protein EV420DRAFT_1622437 [Desarmillaria tabescens]
MMMQYDVWFRDLWALLINQLGNPDFAQEMDFTPKQVDLIAKDPMMHDSTFCPAILSSNKTTVSCAHCNGVELLIFLSIPKIESFIFSHQSDLDGEAARWLHVHTMACFEAMSPKELWDNYGIVDGILPFTHGFPCTDIHELLSSDLLHQVIKGTFKDHLVMWIEEYIVQENDKKDATRILADID